MSELSSLFGGVRQHIQRASLAEWNRKLRKCIGPWKGKAQSGSHTVLPAVAVAIYFSTGLFASSQLPKIVSVVPWALRIQSPGWEHLIDQSHVPAARQLRKKYLLALLHIRSRRRNTTTSYESRIVFKHWAAHTLKIYSLMTKTHITAQKIRANLDLECSGV